MVLVTTADEKAGVQLREELARKAIEEDRAALRVQVEFRSGAVVWMDVHRWYEEFAPASPDS